MRVGVNSGEVVVRSISTGDGNVEYTPIGHTANLASRMQTLAMPGSIVVSDNTRKLVEGYFALKSLGASRVKGINEPARQRRFFPVIDLLHGYFSIDAGDDSRKRREKVNGKIVRCGLKPFGQSEGRLSPVCLLKILT